MKWATRSKDRGSRGSDRAGPHVPGYHEFEGCHLKAWKRGGSRDLGGQSALARCTLGTDSSCLDGD